METPGNQQVASRVEQLLMQFKLSTASAEVVQMFMEAGHGEALAVLQDVLPNVN